MLLNSCKKQGAVIVDPIDLGVMENDLGYNVLLYEFKSALNAYLGKTPMTNPIRTLADVIEYNNAHPDDTLEFGQVMLERVERTSGNIDGTRLYRGPSAKPASGRRYRSRRGAWTSMTCRRLSSRKTMDVVSARLQVFPPSPCLRAIPKRGNRSASRFPGEHTLNLN